MKKFNVFALYLCASVPFFPSSVFAQVAEGRSVPNAISCMPQSTGELENSAFGLQVDEHIRNTGNECALVADVNLKIDSGFDFRTGSAATAYGQLVFCMSAAACYFPTIGTLPSSRCMKALCECNKRMVVGELECGGSVEGYDCEKIEDALAKGGGAQVFVSGPGFNHAVEVTDINCDLTGSGGVSGGTYRDPDDPARERPFFAGNGNGKIFADGEISGGTVYGQYTAH